jgi:hypothetical protein
VAKRSSRLQTLLHEPETLLHRQQVMPQRHPVQDVLAFAGGVLLGAIIGGAIAVFFAPSDGESLRRRIKRELGMEDESPFEPASTLATGTTVGADAVTGVPAPASTVVSTTAT